MHMTYELAILAAHDTRNHFVNCRLCLIILVNSPEKDCIRQCVVGYPMTTGRPQYAAGLVEMSRAHDSQDRVLAKSAPRHISRHLT